MIDSVDDYQFVIGANADAEHPHGDLDRIKIDGGIFGYREKGGILRGEDICFLQEAVARRLALIGNYYSPDVKTEFTRKLSAAQVNGIVDALNDLGRRNNLHGNNDDFTSGLIWNNDNIEVGGMGVSCPPFPFDPNLSRVNPGDKIESPYGLFYSLLNSNLIFVSSRNVERPDYGDGEVISIQGDRPYRHINGFYSIDQSDWNATSYWEQEGYCLEMQVRSDFVQRISARRNQHSKSCLFIGVVSFVNTITNNRTGEDEINKRGYSAINLGRGVASGDEYVLANAVPALRSCIGEILQYNGLVKPTHNPPSETGRSTSGGILFNLEYIWPMYQIEDDVFYDGTL